LNYTKWLLGSNGHFSFIEEMASRRKIFAN